ncbi:hypothetical protein JG688_00006585, partial [Phytophthora aleatoria]
YWCAVQNPYPLVDYLLPSPAHLDWRGTLARSISPSDSHQLLNRCGIRTLA